MVFNMMQRGERLKMELFQSLGMQLLNNNEYYLQEISTVSLLPLHDFSSTWVYHTLNSTYCLLSHINHYPIQFNYASLLIFSYLLHLHFLSLPFSLHQYIHVLLYFHLYNINITYIILLTFSLLQSKISIHPRQQSSTYF